MTKYVPLHEIVPEMLIYLAHSSTTPSKILEINEPTHPYLEETGAVVATVMTYAMSLRRWGPVRRVTLHPTTSYRVEENAKLWETL